MKTKNALMVLIDLYTGLRIGELCGLSWLDFGPGKEYFKIQRILERLSKNGRRIEVSIKNLYGWR